MEHGIELVRAPWWGSVVGLSGGAQESSGSAPPQSSILESGDGAR